MSCHATEVKASLGIADECLLERLSKAGFHSPRKSTNPPDNSRQRFAATRHPRADREAGSGAQSGRSQPSLRILDLAGAIVLLGFKHGIRRSRLE